MAKFISISGPSTTGKTSIVNILSSKSEFSNFVIGPDMHDEVWYDLLSRGIFEHFTDISTDSDYLCTYIMRVVDHYNAYIEKYKDTDAVVLLDGCWLDLSIYAILYMWYTRIIKSVQEEILRKISIYDENISRIYITKADDDRYPVDKSRLRGKLSTFRNNRPLEIRYYEVFKHLKNTIAIPTSDTSEAVQFIIDDLRNLGYL